MCMAIDLQDDCEDDVSQCPDSLRGCELEEDAKPIAHFVRRIIGVRSLTIGGMRFDRVVRISKLALFDASAGMHREPP
jgi:hypothetical protein